MRIFCNFANEYREQILADGFSRKRLRFLIKDGKKTFKKQTTMSKVLIISASPRKNGNSDILSEQFRKGAEEAGHEVETIFVRDLKLNYCIGCLACQKTGRCVLKDPMNDILPKLMEADAICFCTPVYYYSVSGQMKVFLDRCNPLYDRMRDKDFYYMLTAADDDRKNLEYTMDALHGFALCFNDIREKDRIYGAGAEAKGDVRNLPAFTEAYEMGKGI